MDDILKDERFKHIAKDSRFKEMRKKERKFKVDTRFKKMFSDNKFKLKYSVDKRGRPVNLTSNDNLKKFYELSSSESDEKDSDNDNENKNKHEEKDRDLKNDNQKNTETKSSSENENAEETDKSIDEETSDTDTSESDDESDSEDSLDDEEKEELEIAWNELDKDTIRDEKISSRLACCNMDWDRIKATDLFVLLNSFKPPDGVIKSVKIYISEFGKERIAYEKLHGPAELNDTRIQNRKNNEIDTNEDNQNSYIDNEESDEDKNADDEELGNNFNRFKLRQYQFNRLKYYYAIIECDNAQTANKIYTECDGNEYESSCTRLDLRFVPEDTEFNEEDVTQSCLEAPDPLAYKPNLFVTTALNQTKVECTWDETPRERLAITMKNYTEDELKKSNFNGILAMSSEEEDEGEQEEVLKDNIKTKEEKNTVLNQINKAEDGSSKKTKKPKAKNGKESEQIRQYRELLFNSGTKSEKKRDGDLEFSWEGGMEEEGFNSLLFDSKKKNENKSKKFDNKTELTDEKLKEQAQLSLMTMDMEENNKAHFNLNELIKDQPKKSKKKSRKNDDEDEMNGGKKVDDFKLNVNDPRFEALFVDHNFNIDPSNQLFKKTNAMETLVQEKLKRKSDNTKLDVIDDEKVTTKNNADLSLMIKSIKSKTEVHKKIKYDKKFSEIKKIK